MLKYINIDEKRSMVEAHFSGAASTGEIFELTRKSIALAEHEQIYQLLFDCTDFSSGLMILDLLEFAKKLASAGYADKAKLAVLMPPNIAISANIQFWENLCQQHTIQTRFFNDRSITTYWLQQDLQIIKIT